jgi:exonuclease III
MLADARYDATQNTLNQIAGLLAAERNERIAGDINITNTVNDTQSGSQQGSIAAQIENSAMATATAQIMTGMMTGQYSQNPQRVTLWQDAKACSCNTGCGCGQ